MNETATNVGEFEGSIPSFRCRLLERPLNHSGRLDPFSRRKFTNLLSNCQKTLRSPGALLPHFIRRVRFTGAR
jgi:hypothetical protein